MGAAVSSVSAFKQRMIERGHPHPSALKTGGSVESFESDCSCKDEIDSECIYEDIIDTFFPNYKKQT